MTAKLHDEVTALRRLGPCRSCGESGVDLSSRFPCLCPSGQRLRRILAAEPVHRNLAAESEPCYGTCAGCGIQNAVLWRVGSRWLCWRCAG